MQLSTRARYGLRALLDIALHGQRAVLLQEIAERQGISRSYLEQLLLVLQSAGFIRGIRGRRGGFVLVRPPSEIRLGEVVRALERTLSLAGCVEDPQACPRAGHCTTHYLWQRLTEVLQRELNSLTLEDLLRWQSGGQGVRGPELTSGRGG